MDSTSDKHDITKSELAQRSKEESLIYCNPTRVAGFLPLLNTAAYVLANLTKPPESATNRLSVSSPERSISYQTT